MAQGNTASFEATHLFLVLYNILLWYHGRGAALSLGSGCCFTLGGQLYWEEVGVEAAWRSEKTGHLGARYTRRLPLIPQVGP